VIALETWDGRVAGFEVKAGSRVQDTDLSGLRLLRDRLGERFIAGFLLNLGELAYRKEETIMVIGCSQDKPNTRHGRFLKLGAGSGEFRMRRPGRCPGGC
jgi:hypothetical protein